MSLAATLGYVPDMIKDCRENLDALERKFELLEKHNEELQSQVYKDSLVEQLQKQVKELQAELNANAGFRISAEENKTLHSWMDAHEKVHPGGHGCSGGKYTYIFLPTGLGTSGTIRCSCGAEFEFQKIG